MDESSSSQLLDAGLRLAALRLAKENDGFPKCFGRQERPDITCVTSFVSWHAENVFLTPPTDEEIEALVSFGMEAQAAFAPRQAKLMLTGVVYASPRSIYWTEIGAGPPDSSGRRMLEPRELAHALAFAINGAAAGSKADGVTQALRQLEQLASEGELRSGVDIEPLVRRLLDAKGKETCVYCDEGGSCVEKKNECPEGSACQEQCTAPSVMASRVHSFFLEFLGYGDPELVFKSGGPEYSYRQPQYLEGHTTQVLQGIMRQDRDVLRQILTTREGRVFGFPDGEPNPENAVYNIDALLESTRVTFPEEQRAGLLTQPAWLAAQSRNVYDEAHAVYRGKWIYENLLCGHVPELPITVDATLPEDTTRTTRARLDSVTTGAGNEYCAGCHALMNPLGVPFEIYDHRGQWRHEEQLSRVDEDGSTRVFSAPVDASSTLVMTGDPELDGKTVRDAVELMELLAESQVVEQCFVRQTFRYFMGRPETLQDGCTLASMYDSYTRSGGSLEEMLVTLFTSDTFLYRTVHQEMP